MARQRIEQQPAFVLHTQPWRETSLIVELFSRDHGRLPLVAKGARRPTSAFRGLLMGFQPLLADWSGGGEVRTLARAEWQGGIPLLAGRALLSAYYLNELLVQLMPREDARYLLIIEEGVVAEGRAGQGAPVSGQALLQLSRGEFSDAGRRAELKQLSRSLISHHLGGKRLESRRVFTEFAEL